LEFIYTANRSLAVAAKNKSRAKAKIDAALTLLSGIQCLAMPEMETTAKGTTNKYQGYSHTCMGHGMWANDARPTLKCIFLQLVGALKIKPLDVILDWGGGCGHQLALFNYLYGTFGINIDLSDKGIDWQHKHYPNTVGCAQDGTDLSNIPSNSVDHVISYAALYHIKPEQQCSVLLQFLRILRPGGNIWVGWIKRSSTGGYIGVPCSFWTKCLKQEEGGHNTNLTAQIDVCADEMKHWGTTVYSWPIHDSLIVTKLN